MVLRLELELMADVSGVTEGVKGLIAGSNPAGAPPTGLAGVGTTGSAAGLLGEAMPAELRSRSFVEFCAEAFCVIVTAIVKINKAL